MENTEIQTVPNQEIIVVHREKVAKDFIQISKENFAAAYQQMSRYSSAIALYVWLVGNKDGYRMAHSPQAIYNTLGMPLSSCRGGIKKLKELGFLVQRKEGSNVYDFYEVAKMPSESEDRPKEVREEKTQWVEEGDFPMPIAKPGAFTF